jgi:hypothetical protein
LRVESMPQERRREEEGERASEEMVSEWARRE